MGCDLVSSDRIYDTMTQASNENGIRPNVNMPLSTLWQRIKPWITATKWPAKKAVTAISTLPPDRHNSTNLPTYVHLLPSPRAHAGQTDAEGTYYLVLRWHSGTNGHHCSPLHLTCWPNKSASLICYNYLTTLTPPYQVPARPTHITVTSQILPRAGEIWGDPNGVGHLDPALILFFGDHVVNSTGSPTLLSSINSHVL